MKTSGVSQLRCKHVLPDQRCSSGSGKPGINDILSPAASPVLVQSRGTTSLPALLQEGKARGDVGTFSGVWVGGGRVRAHFWLPVLALRFPAGIETQTVPSSAKLRREENPPKPVERSSSSCRLSSLPGEEGATEDTRQGSGC